MNILIRRLDTRGYLRRTLHGSSNIDDNRIWEKLEFNADGKSVQKLVVMHWNQERGIMTVCDGFRSNKEQEPKPTCLLHHS